MSIKGREPTNDDLSLWSRFVNGVKPLAGKALSRSVEDIHPASHEKNIKKPTNNQPVKKRNILQTQTKSAKNNTNAPSAQLDGKTHDRLRKGKIPIEGVLDMHGMTQDQAHNALIHFATNAFNHHRRCVLVITGKGTRSLVKGGVLRTQLPNWLSVSPLNHMVITHVPAKHKDGGDGAFYLYLKRHRSENNQI